MRVFVAGATGVLGRRLVARFAARGDEAVGLVRRPEAERAVAELGGIPRRANLFDEDELARAAAGCEVVIHAASSIPVVTKPGPSDWAANDRIRREGTRALTACAARIGARCFVQQSLVWVARPADGSFFDEESPVHPDEVSRSTYDGELLARAAGREHGFAVAVLRCGWFYGPDCAHTKLFAEGLRRRRLPVIGKGDALWACLHADDAAEAFVRAAEAQREGLWHVVDDEPVPAATFVRDFAARLGAPAPARVPVFAARLAAGSYAVEFFTSSTHTANTRIREDLGFRPRYPSYREGLDQIVAAWRAA